MVLVGLLASVIERTILSWDGAYYLLSSLQHGRPFVIWGRMSIVPMQLPHLLARGLTDDVRVMAWLLGASYAAIPVGSLLLSWRIVRDRAPALFVWPVLGICMLTLPASVYPVSEAVQLCSLAWPLVLAALCGMRGEARFITALLAPALLLLHPGASGLFAIVATALLLFARNEGWPRRLVGAAMLLLLAGIGRRLMVRSSYEQASMSSDILKMHWDSGVAGFVALSGTCVIIGGALLVLARVRGVRARPALLRALAVGVVAMGWMALLPRLTEPNAWASALNWRSWILLFNAPLLLLAASDAYLQRSFSDSHTATDDGRWACPLVVCAALGFAVVSVAQARVWGAMLGRLESELAAMPASCTSTTSLPWLHASALSLWPTPSLAVLVQGKEPRVLLLEDGGCERARNDRSIRFHPLEPALPVEGWFRFTPALDSTARAMR